MRDRLRNPFVQQYVLEIFLPLIGYLFFDWSVIIIAVFYLLDQIAGEISFGRKYLTIAKHDKTFSPWWIALSIPLFSILLLLECAMLFTYFTEHCYLQTMKPCTDQIATSQLISFAKEELWILFPLLVIVYYMKDQFTFFMPRRFTRKKTSAFFWYHQLNTIIIFSLISLAFFVLPKKPLHDIILIVAFLVMKITYDLTFTRWLEKKSDLA